eukprot:m.457857 g.457857  ORF g.457857 m.457857 type:complete len:311 (-) comp21362_c0_seq1:56-988(-)
MADHTELEHQALAVFSEFDTDGSGTITLDEIQAMVDNDRLDFLPSGTTAEAMMAELDNDGDGEVTKDEFLQFVLGEGEKYDNQFDEGATLSRSRNASRRRALDWVKSLMQKGDADVDELVAFGDSDDDATQMQLTARMNSEMQGDLDFDMELEDELSISDAVLLSDGDRLMHSRISHEEVEAAREAILAHEDLESQIRVVQSELEAEQEARKSAELDALAVAADRDTLRRLLDAEKAARAADVAQRDATIEHLQLEMRKSRNAQVEAMGRVENWAKSQSTVNERLGALLQQHKSEMAQLQNPQQTGADQN